MKLAKELRLYEAAYITNGLHSATVAVSYELLLSFADHIDKKLEALEEENAALKQRITKLEK